VHRAAMEEAVEAPVEASVGLPLYETLVAAFPQGLMPEGLEHSMRGKVRKRLRDIGYRVAFLPGEPWQTVIEHFAIASVERIHRGFGDNPWFWVVQWPRVFGAAAVDFWPEVGAPAERHALAADASAAHLEAILVTRALYDSEAIGALPMPAVKGLRALGQSALPALPGVSVNEKALLLRTDGTKLSNSIAAPPIPNCSTPTVFSPDSGDGPSKEPTPNASTEAGTAQQKEADVKGPRIASWEFRVPMPSGAVKLLRPAPRPLIEPSATTLPVESARSAPHVPDDDTDSESDMPNAADSDPRVQTGMPMAPPGGAPCDAARARIADPGIPRPPTVVQGAAVTSSVPVCECGNAAVRVERATEVYGPLYGDPPCALCNQCWEPCGLDSPGEARKAAFLHCPSCSRDTCAMCLSTSTTLRWQ